MTTKLVCVKKKELGLYYNVFANYARVKNVGKVSATTKYQVAARYIDQSLTIYNGE